MNDSQLKYLCEIAETKSLNKAAKNLYMTAPSLSSALSVLEEELGIPLLIRTKVGVTPTASALKLIEYYRQFDESIEKIKEEYHNERKFEESMKSELNIYVCKKVIDSVLYSSLKNIICNTSIKINIYEISFYDLCTMVSNEEIPYGLVITAISPDGINTSFAKLHQEDIRFKNIQFRKIREYYQTVEVGKSSALAELNTISMKNILKYRHVSPINLHPNDDNYSKAGIHDVHKGLEDFVYVPSEKLYKLLLATGEYVGDAIGEKEKIIFEDDIVRIPVREGWRYHFGYVYTNWENVSDEEKTFLKYICDDLENK